MEYKEVVDIRTQEEMRALFFSKVFMEVRIQVLDLRHF